MPEFLSDEWIVALDHALRELRSAGPTTVVEQRVTTTSGTVVYHLTIGPDRIRATAGAADRPHVVLITDARTAGAIARGDLAPRRAAAEARLSIEGDPGTLPAHLESLAGLASATASLRATTTFAPD